MSRQQIYDWESAVSVPDRERFPLIEEVYGLPSGAVESALLAVAGESMAYWRGRIDEAREVASELAARLAALSAEMQGESAEDYRELLTQTDATTPVTNQQKRAQ